jgi:hypothetical protein
MTNSLKFAEELEGLRGRMTRDETLLTEVAIMSARHSGALAICSRIIDQVAAERDYLLERVASLAPQMLAPPPSNVVGFGQRVAEEPEYEPHSSDPYDQPLPRFVAR